MIWIRHIIARPFKTKLNASQWRRRAMKIQRYSIDGLHAYPEDNGDYIKVSELRKLLKEEQVANICFPFNSSYEDGVYEGTKAILEKLLAALDGKEGSECQ